MVNSSATRLSRAASCGRWVGDYPTQSSQQIGENEQDVGEPIRDGNLRHALLEYYLTRFAAQNCSLQEPDIWCIVAPENWDETQNFLDGFEKPLPQVTLLTCQKIVKKLASVLLQWSKLIEAAGTLDFIGAEISIGDDGPIPIFDQISIPRGEIDALFRITRANGRILILIIDWKRTLHEEGTNQNYIWQLQVYSRCVKEDPNLAGLSQEEMQKAEIKAFLCEVGGNEAKKLNKQQVSLDEEIIDDFLLSAREKIESLEESPGPHCSSWCPWAFSTNFCNSIDSKLLYIDFHSIEFWSDRKFTTQSFSLVQLKIERVVTLSPSSEESLLFSVDGIERTLTLKRIMHPQTHEIGTILRMEGLIKRIDRKTAEMYVLQGPIVVNE